MPIFSSSCSPGPMTTASVKETKKSRWCVEERMTSILPHPSPPDPPVKQRYIEQGDSFSPSYFECKHPLTHFSSVQSLSHERLFVTPWIAACQASLSITSSQSLFKLMAIEPVMPSSHLILCRPLLLLPPISPSIRVFSNESTLCMRWPKYWSFSFSISPSKEHPGLISGMLNSPATVLLWISSFVSVKICFLYLVGGVCVCVCVCVYTVFISSCWISQSFFFIM